MVIIGLIFSYSSSKVGVRSPQREHLSSFIKESKFNLNNLITIPTVSVNTTFK